MVDPLENTTVSHYRIRRRLGGGGMGVVYEAADLRLERSVAIKFLPPHWSEDEIAKRRFVREARAASSIEHPNICAIHDIDQTADGKLFIVMPLYSGETLKKKIAHGPLPVDEALDYFAQVLRGLEKAHQKGIVHRDVKPANLMVTEDDVVKIVDFGLAKLGGGGQLTQIGQTLGTVEYMSPEQTRAEEVDGRSDLWSAGVVLFEMLTGHRPFRGAPSIAIDAIRSADLPPVSSPRGAIPPEVEPLLQRILSKSKEDRFRSADQASAAIKPASAAVEISSAPTLVYGPAPTARPSRKMLALGAAIVVLLAVAGVFGWRSLREPTAPPVAEQASRLRIAVLAPVSTQSDDASADWPRLIQTALAGELTGVEEFGVFDPLTLNGLIESNLGAVQAARGPEFYELLSRSQIDLVLDGALFESEGSYHLVTSLLKPADGETLLSRTVSVDGDDDLPNAMRQLSEELVEYLQIEALGKKRREDLRPWVSPRKHEVEALRAFMQATEYIFRYEPGGSAYLRRAIEIDPSFITPRVWLVGALVGTESMDEAAQHLEHLRSLEPSASSFERAMIAWAGAYFDGDLEEQARHLEVALSYSPESFVLLSNLGFVRKNMGDCEATLAALRRPVAASWGYPPIYTAQAGCLVELGRFREARQGLDQALAIQPVHPGVYGMLQALAIHAGDDDDARSWGERFSTGAGISVPVDEFEEVGKVFLRVGSDALEAGGLERAVELLRKAVLYSSQDAACHETLGDALHRSGTVDGARDAYAKAVELDGSRARALLMLGSIAEERNEPEAAIAHYRAYLSVQPASAETEGVGAKLRRLETIVNPQSRRSEKR